MNDHNTEPTQTEAELYRHDGKEFVSVTTTICPDGALEVSDCGSGPCCKDFFGVGGVDAVVTVEPSYKDKLR